MQADFLPLPLWNRQLCAGSGVPLPCNAPSAVCSGHRCGVVQRRGEAVGQLDEGMAVAAEVIEALLRGADVPTVIDADGINFLASHIDVLKEMQAPAALTPHPMELSRLTGCGVEEINRNRVHTARAFTAEYGCYLLLKGSRTVIAAPDGRVRITVSGCSALAKGGSGDVLAGVVGALAAQGYDLFDALTVGAFLHGRAGEQLAVRFGAHGALPSQLPEEIGRLLG